MSFIINVLKTTTNPGNFFHPVSTKKGVNELTGGKRFLGIIAFGGLTVGTLGVFGIYSLITAISKQRKIAKMAKEDAAKADAAGKIIKPEKPDEQPVDKPIENPEEKPLNPRHSTIFDRARSAVYSNDLSKIRELIAQGNFSLKGPGFEHLLDIAIGSTFADPSFTVIKEFLKIEGFNINEVFPAPPGYEATPLIKAISTGNKELVKLFLDSGAELFNPKHTFQPALNVACVEGHLEIVKLLIERGDLVKGRDKFPSPISQAVEKKHFEIVEFLRKKGESFPTELTALTKKNSWTALKYLVTNEKADPDVVLSAILEGDETKNSIEYLNLLKALVEHGLKIDSHKAFKGTPPIEWAKKNGKQHLAFFLIHKPENSFEAANLFDVVENNLYQVLSTLLQAGANLKCVDADRNNLLHLACNKGLIPCVKELLKLKISLDTKNNEELTPFQATLLKAMDIKYLASKNETFEILDVMVTNNGTLRISINDIHSYENKPYRFLQIAIEKEDFDAVKFMLKNGALTELFQEGTKPPLMLAVEVYVTKGTPASKKILEQLLDDDANVSMEDEFDNSCLHYLASLWKESSEESRRRILESANMLILKGAIKYQPNKNGKNPYDIFKENGGQDDEPLCEYIKL